MFFIGQEHITYSLGDILYYTEKTKQGVSILFRGPSGYGKTELAKKCCNFLVGRKYQYSVGEKIVFNEDIWVHLIDEVHLIDHPEILYPIIDSGKYVFIFCTNFDSVLPEALSNRCHNFTFVDYTEKNLIDIFRCHSKLQINEPVINHIIDVAGRNPRIIVKTFIKTLEMHFYKKEEQLAAMTDDQLIEHIDSLFGIKDGLDRVSRHYLETLEKLGGRSNINLIAASMKLDINTIKYSVEPALLYKKKIKISSRGRELL